MVPGLENESGSGIRMGNATDFQRKRASQPSVTRSGTCLVVVKCPPYMHGSLTIRLEICRFAWLLAGVARPAGESALVRDKNVKLPWSFT